MLEKFLDVSFLGRKDGESHILGVACGLGAAPSAAYCTMYIYKVQVHDTWELFQLTLYLWSTLAGGILPHGDMHVTSNAPSPNGTLYDAIAYVQSTHYRVHERYFMQIAAKLDRLGQGCLVQVE